MVALFGKFGQSKLRCRNQIIEFHIDYFNKERNFPIETLTVRMKSVVKGKYEFEYRDNTKLLE